MHNLLSFFLSTLGHKLRYHKALKKEAIDNSDNNSTDFFVQPEIGGHFGGPLEGALGTSVTTCSHRTLKPVFTQMAPLNYTTVEGMILVVGIKRVIF